ncbi:MAG: rod-binding protein [Pseudomonadota bacterium]
MEEVPMVDALSSPNKSAAIAAAPSRSISGSERIEAFEDAARAFEAVFIAEMLKHAGVGEPPDSFGGGEGEAQFASLLRDAQAKEMAKAGGIGLAEYLITALGAGRNDR